MPLFDARTVTIAISTQVSSPFAFAGQAIIGAWLPDLNGSVFLQAGLATTAASADFHRCYLAGGSLAWTGAGSSFVTLQEAAVPAPVLRWELGASQTASRAIVMIFKEPGRTPAR
jgi:hypothetical protein